MRLATGLEFLTSPASLKRMAVVFAVAVFAGGAYALLAPRWYESVLTVVPVKQQKGGGLSSLVGGELAGLAASLDTGAGADAARIGAVLQSFAVTDTVIDRFELMKRYDKSYRETARKELWRHCTVKTLNKPNLVQLTCEDKDPEFVKAMLEFFAERGNEVFRRVGVSSASEEARFLEKHVGELRAKADDAAARLREFQERHNIVDLEAQSKAVVGAMAALEGQRIGKELEAEYARTFSGREEASLLQLESQLSVMDRKIRNLGQASGTSPGRRAPPAQSGIFPAAAEVPKLRAEFEALYRERRVSEAALIFALERLEGAQANAARDVSTFVVLDPPTRPTRPVRPRLSSTLLGFALLGAIVAVMLEWLRTRNPALGFLSFGRGTALRSETMDT
jgi:capsule polysaccharide export protein KpsE/RkpR